jgi:lipoprotein-releasing system permease protein
VIGIDPALESASAPFPTSCAPGISTIWSACRVALSSARNWPAGSASTWATSSARRRHRAPRAAAHRRPGQEGQLAARLVQRLQLLREAQSLLGRPFIINRIGIKLSDPYTAQDVARTLEQRYGYKAESWQERSSDSSRWW